MQQTGLAVTVTMTASGPLVAWTAGPPRSTYVTQRIKREDPGCCIAGSPPGQPLVGTLWQDTPLPASGTYIYTVTASGPFGTITGQTSFLWTLPGENLPTGQPLDERAPTERPTPQPPPPTPAAPIQVGTGISDITGPIAEVGMMGYGKFGQIASGLHTRLFARAFIFADGIGGRRVVLVSADLGMVFSSVKQGVLKRLASLYGSRYTADNVMLAATHTHSGPGGYSHHVMYNLTTLGHVAQNYRAIVDGITEAIARADSSLSAGTVSVAEGQPTEPTMVNRSMPAFLMNLDRQDSVSRTMTVLKLQRGGRPVGVIAWHAVHNTSIKNSNALVDADHKGYASYLFEKQYGSIAPFRNYGQFVAGFPNGAEGDMSPNLILIKVPGNLPELMGPGSDYFESARIIGQREFATAHGLFTHAGQEPVPGVIDYRHAYVVMPGFPVRSTGHTNGLGLKHLCPAAYGASFMAGAEDGPSGPLPEGLALGSSMDLATLEQARAQLIGILGLVAGPMLGPVIIPPLADMMARSADSDRCQFPKPVLVPSGHLPNWTPEILPFQLLRVGQMAFAGIPGEMTMQAGKRLQERIRVALTPAGVTRVVLTGLTNEYSGYIATPEEYGSQQYEGASTLYGRLTFDAYAEIFEGLALAMAGGRPAPSSPPPPDLSLVPQIELQTGVLMDAAPPGRTIGEVLAQPPDRVSRGSVVAVIHQAAHPKNDLRRNDSYFQVERDAGGTWEAVAWDATPDTKLFWGRDTACPPALPCPWSTMGIHWQVPVDAVPGRYRIRFTGSWKRGSDGALIRYEGATNAFTVQ